MLLVLGVAAGTKVWFVVIAVGLRGAMVRSIVVEVAGFIPRCSLLAPIDGRESCGFRWRNPGIFLLRFG